MKIKYFVAILLIAIPLIFTSCPATTTTTTNQEQTQETTISPSQTQTTTPVTQEIPIVILEKTPLEPLEINFSAYDYFPVTPGHYILYSLLVGNDKHDINKYETQMEFVFQRTEGNMFLNTQTITGSEDWCFGDAAIVGEERNNRLLYYSGVPSYLQAGWWFWDAPRLDWREE